MEAAEIQRIGIVGGGYVGYGGNASFNRFSA